MSVRTAPRWLCTLLRTPRDRYNPRASDQYLGTRAQLLYEYEKAKTFSDWSGLILGVICLFGATLALFMAAYIIILILWDVLLSLWRGTFF